MPEEEVLAPTDEDADGSGGWRWSSALEPDVPEDGERVEPEDGAGVEPQEPGGHPTHSPSLPTATPRDRQPTAGGVGGRRPAAGRTRAGRRDDVDQAAGRLTWLHAAAACLVCACANVIAALLP